ncbi:hypothetical protein [Criblamydia sequanensis]|uniref:Uncharacterized protein n=1 Tax=Candidatus Criblamydia sequanensis CRIB-18 TaxID=1437425 RepID=A0A090D0R2_9BACT|nr:hypothetical protein [Criblamydia sequanensis]CDR34921.1 hypothetical protein CSEC_2115 [Criblamydia sequanensis CRIB-18]
MSSITVNTLDDAGPCELPLGLDQARALRTNLISSSRVSLLPATLTPVRTNNLSNFSKDFFLPTTLNHAVNTQGTFKKVMAVAGAILLDLLTLPIRLVTSAPRALCNAVFQNPLRKILIEERFSKDYTDQDTIKIEFKYQYQDEFKQTTLYVLKQNLNLVQTPNYVEAARYEEWTYP